MPLLIDFSESCTKTPDILSYRLSFILEGCGLMDTDFATSYVQPKSVIFPCHEKKNSPCFHMVVGMFWEILVITNVGMLLLMTLDSFQFFFSRLPSVVFIDKWDGDVYDYIFINVNKVCNHSLPPWTRGFWKIFTNDCWWLIVDFWILFSGLRTSIDLWFLSTNETEMWYNKEIWNLPLPPRVGRFWNIIPNGYQWWLIPIIPFLSIQV